MQAVWSGKHGEAWKKSGIQIYGWLNAGFNVSSSDKAGDRNLPAAYAEKPNTIQPDQEVLYIERQPDTVQTDHFDWGFRIANLWGIDYRFTAAKGVFSKQLLQQNKEYGYDPVMVYADLYFPHVAEGMNVRIGRYISLPDIEVVPVGNGLTVDFGKWASSLGIEGNYTQYPDELFPRVLVQLPALLSHGRKAEPTRSIRSSR